MKIARIDARLVGVLVAIAGVALSPVVVRAADDGPLFQRNLSDTPALHTEDAGIEVMWLYVPAQNTQGEAVEIEYLVGDKGQPTVAYSRTQAKPLVASWLDGEVEFVGDLAFTGHGRRDAFVGLSLDDGATWKESNLSTSGDLSSFTIADGTDYPGDVIGIATAVEGNKILAAWISRYCASGAPLHSWVEEEKDGLLTAYPELDHPVDVDGGTDPDGCYQLYMDDLFGVAGAQGSSDYADEGYPEVGEVPYACLWTARGTLEQALDDSGTPMENTEGDPIYDITWRAAERITSGRRDVNLVQVTSSPGAGFVVLWQEDPDGLRPGKGLCLDGGFNGAVAHNSTDIWYTYVDPEHFNDVCLDDVEDVYCTPGSLEEFTTTELFGEKPKAAVPFAMPVRITDDSQCKYPQESDTNGDLLDAYCYADFNDNGTADLCASTESWTNPGGTTLEICVTEDGRHLTGRTFATRGRLEMKSYDSDGDGAPDSAWVALIHEKSKAMGTELGDDGEVIDIGKNVWYHTFEFDYPEIAQQGLMLNAPAIDHETGEFFPIYVDEWGNEYYETEIARHGNLAVNSPAAAMASEWKSAAVLLYKQGTINQGGPADVFMRRVVLPDDFDPATDNPFEYGNVQCVAFAHDGTATPLVLLYADGSNPNYVMGLCPAEGMNVSGTTVVACDGVEVDCSDDFPWNGGQNFPTVTEWVQSRDNYNDPSWANPYDVSKDNQAFLDGDVVVLLYSTAPNWKASTIGKEAYNLYARRSFDGGQTWTTLPVGFAHIDGLTYNGDGTETCEDYGSGGQDEYEVCTTYGPGDFEQQRNLSRLTGTKENVLEPRLAPTGGALKKDYTSLLCYDEAAADGAGDWVNCGYTEAPYPEDIRDPSAFFVSYQTADNRVVDEDTGPQPLDMYYGRTFNFGDDYDTQDVCASDLEDPWYPNQNVVCEEGETDWRFDWLEYGKRSTSNDAEITATPDGSRLYAVWSQEDFDRRGNLVGVDAWYRRVFYNLSDDRYDQYLGDE